MQATIFLYSYKVFVSVFLALRFSEIIQRILVYEAEIWFAPYIKSLKVFYNVKYSILFRPQGLNSTEYLN